jgi:lysine 6-dehydrogenase
MPKNKVVLLGLGMQGKAVLYDLVKNSDVDHIVVADARRDLDASIAQYPAERVTARQIDATDEAALASLMGDADLVIETLPGPFARPLGKLAAKVGVSLVSSMYYVDPALQDPSEAGMIEQEIDEIDRLAREKGITILSEFGLDPGIDLVLGAKALGEVDEVREFYSYGAGLPALEASKNPLKYKFAWSVMGVMRAYMRPATIITKGRTLEIEARKKFEPQNCHMLKVDELGADLESYPNGDSVHYARLFGISGSVQEMARYTCRLPGHCGFWDVIVKSGFLTEDAIKIGDMAVSPIEFTAALLGSQTQFRYGGHDRDFTLVRIDVRGMAAGQRRRIVYQMLDWRDLETGLTSMQRTVGFTMSLGAQLILGGQLRKPGLLSPLEVPFDLVLQGLAKHDLHVTRQEMAWE